MDRQDTRSLGPFLISQFWNFYFVSILIAPFFGFPFSDFLIFDFPYYSLDCFPLFIQHVYC